MADRREDEELVEDKDEVVVEPGSVEEAGVTDFIVVQLRHEATRGGVPLTRQKGESGKRKFLAAYYLAYREMQGRPYYDAAADKEAVARYYAARRPGELALEAHMVEEVVPVCPKALYDRLNALLSSSYRTARRRIPLWAVVDRQEDGTVRCAYSGVLIETAGECLRVCKADEEHVTPQSWHQGSALHPGRDMMQIFVVSKKANGSRGNRLFGSVPGVKGTENEGGYVTANPDPVPVGGSAKLSSLFCPKINAGAVARAVLYTLVCYKHTFHRVYFSPQRLEWLVNTAASAPVTLWERHRNAELARLQGTRNPFIDCPHWSKWVNFDCAFQPA
mmetsp:Transcript_29475/g.82322  ORF Transcript_29475/g.82322 Transcript_29475/m.82322 type:complete len:333 (+) Transcript_29475:196-1194(+)|eukprot:CAMPEP_0119122954 /NCGR_PEP_ID=MMETSP1310-20130426/3045_1 /TAXON_ID=464262 /ORGANISM="Genus nov. species nov., Strain RCC2339" /LENGTH=332 /DNA_ID=CAMNT_0007112685 /DNA_START=174 /DNA_END=1172 /DNA_ORIENTATION=-